MTEKPIDPRYSAAFQRRTADDGVSGPGSTPQPAVLSRRRARMAPAFVEPASSAPAAESAEAELVATPFHETAHIDVDDFDAGPDSGDVETDRGDDDGGRFRFRPLLWTIAFFVIGIGLCLASYACYSEFNFQRWTNATPISGTDQWVISDGTGFGTRTVDQFDVLFPRYMSQMAIWIGAVGVATIVMNLFRIAAGASRRR